MNQSKAVWMFCAAVVIAAIFLMILPPKPEISKKTDMITLTPVPAK
jgi:hypothetical protein